MSSPASKPTSPHPVRFAGEERTSEDSTVDSSSSSLSSSTSSKQQSGSTTHSRAPSKTKLDSPGSPPVTPHSFTFGGVGAASSSQSSAFSTPPGTSPMHTPSGSLTVPPNLNSFPFPDSLSPNNTNSGSRGVTLSSPPSRADLIARAPRKSASAVGVGYTGYAGNGNVNGLVGSRPNTSGDPNGHTLSRPTSQARFRETFASPRPRPLTMYSSVQNSTVKIQRERPKSTMLTPEKREELNDPEKKATLKPWLETRDPLMRVAYFMTYGVMLLGVIAGGVRCFFGWRGVPVLKGNLCPVMIEDFDSEDGVFGDNGRFFREVDMSGFGNGEFEMSTNSRTNSYVRDGYLYITPTLTSDIIGEAAIEDGHVFNITDCTFNITQGVSYTSSIDTPGSSTPQSAIGADQEFDLAGYTKACSAVSNATAGTIINPIQSARLSTRRSASIRFGKVEVRAKIPTGDWLWPAIWMLPVDNVYGGWPMSGEIDIMEARGNGPLYPNQGANYVRGSLNWGPNHALNRAYKTYGWWSMRRGSYDQDFHTYTLEWDEDFIRISVDSRLHHLLDLRIKKSFWDFGEFPPMINQGAEQVALHNMWANGTKAAPFDQNFYLILDVGAGGTNGWFPDGKEKPWYDGSQTAMGAFWRARHEWLPTWPTEVEKRSMVIDYVKMWQKC